MIDAANVTGSRPNGWWRDRPGAAAKLVAGVVRSVTAGELAGPVVVVLEGAARAGAPAESPATGVRVVHAERDGDAAIVAEVAALSADGVTATVVTADRGLRARVTAAGGEVVGPSWLLSRLP